MIRGEIKSSVENNILMSSKVYGRYLFKRPFSNGVMLKGEALWSYIDNDGLIIPFEDIIREEEEDAVLLWEIVKLEPLVVLSSIAAKSTWHGRDGERIRIS